MSLADAEFALTEAITATLSPTACARENVKFVKPTGAKWAELFWMANQPTGFTLGDTGEDMYSGIAQVDIHYPAGVGTELATTDVETFRAAFKAGHSFVHNFQAITVKNCGAPHRRKEDNWFIVSVTIGWYALVPR